MKKRLIFTLLLPLFNGAYAIAADETTESPSVVAQQITTETLDALLAPVALYPDTVVTHILIASTYPLQVVEADRWRQANAGLEEPALSSALEAFDWDPSVKALVPFY